MGFVWAILYEMRADVVNIPISFSESPRSGRIIASNSSTQEGSPKMTRGATLSSSPEEDFVIVSANLTTDDQNNDSVAERKLVTFIYLIICLTYY